jgi:hypothetical protein
VSDVSQGPGWWRASDEKWYPPSTPPPPVAPRERRPSRRARVAGAVVLVLGLGIVVYVVASPACGCRRPGYEIGQTALTSNFAVTVYGCADPQSPASPFDAGPARHHFVSVDVQVTNRGTTRLSFSSTGWFRLFDAQSHAYDESLNAGFSHSAPDGRIAGGQSIRGLVVFDVPDGTTGLEFRAQGSSTTAGATWILSACT